MGWRLAVVVSLIQGTKEVYACLLLPFFSPFLGGGGGGGVAGRYPSIECDDVQQAY